MEGLETMSNLRNLNLNFNKIQKIENISKILELRTLHLESNEVGTNGISDLLHLVECKKLGVLYLNSNKIEDPKVLDDVFAKMENLRVLYTKNNPFRKDIKNFRRTMIFKIKGLTYLDDRPVFPEESKRAH